MLCRVEGVCHTSDVKFCEPMGGVPVRKPRHLHGTHSVFWISLNSQCRAAALGFSS